MSLLKQRGLFDKKGKEAYMWYSGATDVTGKKLAEALDIEHGKEQPETGKSDLIIGWGTKIKRPIGMKEKTINHPNSILSNRDKLEALVLMQEQGVMVADFAEADAITEALEEGEVTLPLVGRTKYHQGGKGFWLCPTLTHVEAAISEGAAYFQDMIEIQDEYRLHVFNGKVIYVVKKVKRSKEDYQEAFVRHELDRQKVLAEKNENPFDEATARLVLERMAKKKVADGADMIIRSNRLGWKFSHIKTGNVDDHLAHEAVNALDALNLEFGAVDCCIDANGNPYIIEVNTGPGLEETPFAVYVEAFKEEIGNIFADKEDPTVEKVKETFKPTESKGFSSAKNEMLAKAAVMTELIENADENEAATLKSVFSKMFS